MASDVKAWSVPVEDFLLRLLVTIGTLDLCLLTTPRSFASRLQHPGCTKHVIKVQVRGFQERTPRLPGVSPGAFETHTFPTSALQNHQLTLRKAGSFVTRLDARAASGHGRRSDPQTDIAEPYRGPIQAREVGNGGVRVLTGINVPNEELVAVPLVTLVPAWPPFGLQLPGTVGMASSWFRHGWLLGSPRGR